MIQSAIPVAKIFTSYGSISEASEFCQIYHVGVVCSVHALVRFTPKFECLYLIWNPVTKMFKTVLQPSRNLSQKIHCGRSSFCYDHVDRDFKIVVIQRYEMESELGRVLFRVKVYSCNLDIWTEINVTDDFIPYSDFYIAANLKGRLNVRFHSGPNVLAAFDVHGGVFKQLPCVEHSIEGVNHCRYINWKDSLGVSVCKMNDQKDFYGQEVVYTFDETSRAWVQEYIMPMVPDYSYKYRSLLGLECGHIVVNVCDGSLQLFEAQSCEFKDVISGTPALIWCYAIHREPGMQQL